MKTMKNIALAVTISVGVGCFTGCASESNPSAPPAKPAAIASQTPVTGTPTGTNVFSNEKARNSYAIGMSYGHNFQVQGVEPDIDMVVRGMKDILSGGPMLLTEKEARDTLADLQNSIAAKQRKLREEAAAKNKTDGEAFLAKNKTEPGVVTLPDGLQYKVITNGDGTIPLSNDVVTVNYRGTLINGTEFDNSVKHGKSVQFPVGKAIPGWTEALTHMKVGSKWQLFVPSELAYGGRERTGSIPANSVLIFEVELLATEHQPPPASAVSTNSPLTSDIIKVPSQEEMKKGAKIEVIKPEDAAKYQQSQTNQPAK